MSIIEPVRSQPIKCADHKANANQIKKRQFRQKHGEHNTEQPNSCKSTPQQKNSGSSSTIRIGHLPCPRFRIEPGHLWGWFRSMLHISRLGVALPRNSTSRTIGVTTFGATSEHVIWVYIRGSAIRITIPRRVLECSHARHKIETVYSTELEVNLFVENRNHFVEQI